MNIRFHILIIDDNVDNIQVAINILREDGYEFSFATTGQEGLDILQNKQCNPVDLVLLDIMMPGQDGYSVCQTIKKTPLTTDIPVIFLTARTDIDSIKKGFDAGGVDYITKPYRAEELLSRVRTHIELYRAKKLLQENNITLRSKLKFEHQRLLTELEENQKEMIWMLTELMEATSDETGKHIRRVAEISALLAKFHPTMSAEDEEILFHASPMHDIGKLTIPADLLHKTGRYSEEEFRIMQQHTTNAWKLLKNSDRRLLKAAAIIAHQHHEKWNGKGYPQQLKNTDIHIYGRIVALADVFDALTHKRCYKESWSIQSAVNYIETHRGSQFDPDLVDIFMNHLEDFIDIIQRH